MKSGSTKKWLKLRLFLNPPTVSFQLKKAKKSRLCKETGSSYNSLPLRQENCFNTPCHPYQVRHVNGELLLSWVCQLPRIRW
jgi:hypothetical protein